MLSHFSHVQLFATPWTVACQAPPSMGFPRQEYWSGLPFPSPGGLPNPRIKPVSSTLAGRFFTIWTSRGAQLGKSKDPLEKEMATHSSILAWKIPWMEEPGRLQSMGSQRVGHNWATSLHFNTSVGFSSSSVIKNPPDNVGEAGSLPGLGRSLGEGNGNPLQYSCVENLMDRGAWWATVHRVAESQTWLSD